MSGGKDTFTLTVNGQRYERWEEIRVTREIDRMCTDFNIAVSERFLASPSVPMTMRHRPPASLDLGTGERHRGYAQCRWPNRTDERCWY
jgi:prophage tail gpP-like protein